MPETKDAVKYKLFYTSESSLPQLLQEAAAFASQLGRDRLIGITHSTEASGGAVVVWYWAPAGAPTGAKA